MVPRIASIAVALTLALTTAHAAPPSCATSDDLAALNVSALQQHLMVAALTCHKAPAYNRFVTENRPTLIDADKALLAYFHRILGADGKAAYHTYKTEMANDFSMQSLRNPNFCAEAEDIFTQALVDGASPLTLATWHPSAEADPACPLEQASSD